MDGTYAMTRNTAQTAAPARKARRVPVPRVWPVTANDFYRSSAGNALLIVGMWVRHGGLARTRHDRRHLHRRRRDQRSVRHLPGPDPARPDVAQPLARPGLRPGPDHRRASLGRLRRHLAAGVPRHLHDDRLRDGRGAIVVDEFLTLLDDVSRTCSGRPSALVLFIVRGHQLRAGRRAAGRRTRPGTPSTSTRIWPSRSASSTSSSSASTSRPTASPSLYWIGLYAVAFGLLLVFRFGQPIAISWRHRFHVANVVEEAPGVASLYLTGRDLDQLAGPRRPVVPAALPDQRGLVPGPPVLDLGRPERQVPALHGQGTGRLHEDAAADAGRDARLRRRSVRRPDRRGPHEGPGSAGRRRHRHHAAARAARGAAGVPRQPDARLPRQRPRGRGLQARDRRAGEPPRRHRPLPRRAVADRARCRPIRSIRGRCGGSCRTSTTATSTSAARPG